MVSKPTNILYLSSYGDTGRGGQESLFQLVKNLTPNQFRPVVVLPTDESLAARLRDYQVETVVVNFSRILDVRLNQKISAFKKIYELCSDRKICLINSDGPRNTFYGGVIAKARRIPLVWHVRASNKDRYDRFLYHLASKIILVADALRSRFYWVKKSDKFITIYNGVDLNEFKFSKTSAVIRKKYGIGEKELLITTTARIEPLKGQKYLIEACGELRKKIENWYILLIGDAVDVNYLRQCKDKAVELGIEKRVIFAGPQDNISQILSESDIFVLPSFFEAFPRSVIEAMGVGKPIIVTDVGGCREAVEDSVSGFVVPAGDTKILANKICTLGSDSRLRQKFGESARMRAEKMFETKINVSQTERLYTEILKSR